MDLIPFISYAMQALPHDMVGIAMTNAGSQVVPTFGSEAIVANTTRHPL
jgi:LDH2 family malate/lactate/ureidoglycolate dehydrogenase